MTMGEIPLQAKCLLWLSRLCYSSFERYIKSGSNLELECALILDSGLEPHAVTVEWYWQGVRILNNSRVCRTFVKYIELFVYTRRHLGVLE